MNLDDLTKRQGAWLREGGPDSDVVISSRIRLARNVSGYPFANRATENDLQSIVKIASSAAEKVLPEGAYSVLNLQKISRDDAMFLCERQLVSPEFAESVLPRALILAENEEYSVMINEEDHLRIQATSSGLVLKELWEKIDKLDDLLESQIDYAFDDDFGYLTACPSNVGTGVRVSVMLHLPALIETGEIAKVFRSLQKMNLAVRGMYGEGSRAFGELFQVSNQTTLGVSETAIVDQLQEVIPCVLRYEREAREAILEKNRDGILDRSYRALGLLKSARLTSMEEAMEYLSSLRLGVHLKLLKQVKIGLIDELLMLIQPIHLRRIAEMQGYDADDDDALRADYLRERLAGLEFDGK